LIVIVAGLSAVFSNDIVCLAVAPVLIDACRDCRLDPIPYLLALACAANIGSAAALIGNPQNTLIGETLKPLVRRLPGQAAMPVLSRAASDLGIRRLAPARALATGLADAVVADLAQAGVDLREPGVLFLVTFWPQQPGLERPGGDALAAGRRP